MRTQAELPKALVDLLGKRSDMALARLFRVSPVRVAETRRRLSIAPIFVQLRLPPRLMRLLGRMPDERLAKKANATRQQIKYMRYQLGIPAYRKKPRDFLWTVEDIKLLGTDADRVIAGILDTTAIVVSRKRRALAIEAAYPCTNPNAIEWTTEMISLLGKVRDPVVARRFGVSLDQICRQRALLNIPPCTPHLRLTAWTPQMLKDVRDMEPAQFVLKHKISLGVVSRKRRGMGLAEPRPPRINWTAEMIARLGTVPDGILARELGIRPKTVWAKRSRLGIPCRPEVMVWTPQMLEEIREMKPAEFALKHKLSVEAVYKRRRGLGLKGRWHGGSLV